jgi:putative Mn2+ efflux pump MntP
MTFLEILLIAVGLAADAFAVSVSAGAAGAIQGPRSMLRLSFYFGFFQFLMPVIGWLAGLSIAQYVQSFDHWIAFGLLVWVAIRMIQSTRKDEKHSTLPDPSRGIILLALSIATSIDALAVGLSLAFLQVSIWYPATIIGIVTGTTSFIGILLGKRFSRRLGKQAAIMGGVLLILIGIRILIAHLFAI